jgi:hypothetical protein
VHKRTATIFLFSFLILFQKLLDEMPFEDMFNAVSTWLVVLI